MIGNTLTRFHRIQSKMKYATSEELVEHRRESAKKLRMVLYGTPWALLFLFIVLKGCMALTEFAENKKNPLRPVDKWEAKALHERYIPNCHDSNLLSEVHAGGLTYGDYKRIRACADKADIYKANKAIDKHRR